MFRISRFTIILFLSASWLPSYCAEAQRESAPSTAPAAAPQVEVKIIDPKDKESVFGRQTITATATADSAIATVQFRVGNQNVGSPQPVGPRLTYTFQWDTTQIENGTYTLSAIGLDKNGERLAQSPSVTVLVQNLRITAPVSGTTQKGPIDLTAAGPEKSGVVVQFRLNDDQPPDPDSITHNINLAANGSGGNYTTSWDSAAVLNGTHLISAIAKDPTGKWSYAVPVKVQIKNPPVILGVAAVPRARSAVVNWTANMDCQCQVSYGPTNEYGWSTPFVPMKGSAGSASLTNLTPASTYNYQVSCRDDAGSIARFKNQTFVVVPEKPDDVKPLQEGSNKVEGTFSTTRPAKARVEVVDGKVIEAVEVAVAADSGAFTAVLSSPLANDQEVRVYGVDSTGRRSTPGEFPVASSAMDWGLVRAYFSFGLMLSSNQATSTGSGVTSSSFSSNGASPYLAFDIDNTWVRRQSDFFGRRIGFNTFFGARLTQVGTAAAGVTQAQGQSAAGAASNAGQATSPSSVTAFLANKQAGSVLGGLYLPIVVKPWRTTTGGRPYALYVAPLAKAGFYTTGGNDNTINTVNLTGTNFYTFYGVGARAGLMGEHVDKKGQLNPGSAPDSLIYFDALLSRWSNFEYVSPMTSISPVSGNDTGNCNIYRADPTGAPCFLRERQLRMALEGLVNVPHTPFIIGFSANIAAQRAEAPRVPVNTLGQPAPPAGFNFIRPPNDLRFLFGLRLDAKTLLNALKPPV